MPPHPLTANPFTATVRAYLCFIMLLHPSPPPAQAQEHSLIGVVQCDANHQSKNKNIDMPMPRRGKRQCYSSAPPNRSSLPSSTANGAPDAAPARPTRRTRTELAARLQQSHVCNPNLGAPLIQTTRQLCPISLHLPLRTLLPLHRQLPAVLRH